MLRNINAKYDRKKIWATIQQHLESDYRDPTPRPLPRLGPKAREAKLACTPNWKRADSLKEIFSDTPLWDTLMGMGMLKQRLPKSFMDYRNQQREFIFNQNELSAREARRLTIPANKYVVLELKEDGYDYAAFRLEKLMDKHDRLREPIPPEQIKDKSLRDMSKSVIFLGDILRQANIYRNNREIEKEFSLYFHVARHYEKKKNKYWAWLANSFYKLATKTVHFFKQDSYSKALINYMYGRYLLLKAKDPIFAQKKLQKAFAISEGKPWGAMWTTNVKMERISSYSSYLLHVAQLLTANKISNYDPAKAVQYSEEAVKHARRGDWHPDLEEALVDLAINYSKNEQHDEAIFTLEELNRKIKPKDNRDMYITIQLLLAMCYKRGKQIEKAIQQLFFIVELGRKWNISELKAFGHKYIARYLMLANRMVTARKHLTSCIILNKQMNNFDELLDSVYLHGACKARLHLKEYIDLMINAQTPDHPGFKKLIEFITYGKPFWKVKDRKMYIVTHHIEPLLSTKKVLTGKDKVYLALEAKFGRAFVDCAMKEITKDGNNPPFDPNHYIREDPMECKYFKCRKEAQKYKKFLKEKYKGKNEMLKKMYEEHMVFQIEEREVENELEEIEYAENLNKINPIIPYPKNSPMYKQAVRIIKEHTHPQNVGKPKKVIIDVTNPKVLIRLMNCIVNPGNVVFKFRHGINFKAILMEMHRQRERKREFVHSLPELLRKRYEPEMPDLPVKRVDKIPPPDN